LSLILLDFRPRSGGAGSSKSALAAKSGRLRVWRGDFGVRGVSGGHSGTRMSGDFVSVRILAVCASEPDGDLLRQGATLAASPAFFIHVPTSAAARTALADGNVDIVLLDSAMAERDMKELFNAVRAASRPPSVVLVASTGAAAAGLAAVGVADAIVVKPPRLQDAKALIDSCMRLKVPTRVLVVDDSSTMRTIVCKILSNGRFPVDVAEATDGIDALKQLGAGKFDFVFLDYNMPGLDGIEMLAEIRRQHPGTEIVMMTSAQEEALAARSRGAGAVGFLRKPFYPTEIDAMLYAFYGLRPPAR
jgi:CheY-like chemotaxis protein